jgi:hypothetical protein
MRLRVLLLAALALPAAACGSATAKSDGPLAEASSRMAARGTARAAIGFESIHGPEGVPTGCTMDLDFEHDRAQMHCEGSGLAERMDGPIDVRIIGATSYVRIGKSASWAKVIDEDPGLARLDPRKLLAELQKGAKQLAVVGDETIAGVKTTHYRVVLGPGVEEIGPPGSTAQLWIDEDGLVRRLRTEERGSEEADVMAVVADFSDFGEELDIQPPPADQVSADPYPSPPDCAASAHPFTYEELVAALQDANALDGPPEDRMVSCDGDVLRVAARDGLTCTLHPEPFARASAERHVKRGKVEYSRLNLACSSAQSDEVAFAVVMSSPY